MAASPHARMPAWPRDVRSGEELSLTGDRTRARQHVWVQPRSPAGPGGELERAGHDALRGGEQLGAKRDLAPGVLEVHEVFERRRELRAGERRDRPGGVVGGDSEPGRRGQRCHLVCICRGPDASGGNEFCCSEQWSYLCVDGLAALPECKFTTNECCEAHPTDGCQDKAVEQCVCAEVNRQKQEETAAGRDPALVHDCCSEGWTDFCAILADEVCGAGCANAD